jgi:hypothetical protein
VNLQGRHYYVDHNARSTTWLRPEPITRSPQAAVSASVSVNESSANPLPLGWEQRTSDGILILAALLNFTYSEFSQTVERTLLIITLGQQHGMTPGEQTLRMLWSQLSPMPIRI